MGAQVPKRQRGGTDWEVFGTADVAIARIATRQRGVVARRQLLAVGLGRNAIAGRLRRGQLQPLFRGVYLVGHASPMPGATELGAVLACGPGAVLSHESAARLWKLLPSVLRDTTVTVAGRDCRGPGGVKVHRVTDLPRRDTTKLGPVPITSVARTLLDIAAELTARELEQALAEATARSLVRRSQLRELLDRTAPRPGSASLAALLDPASGSPRLTRSQAERRLLALVHAAELPQPECNVVIEGLEVDLLWRDARLVVELDGFTYHSSRAAFERDRARDARLVAAGYRVIRVTWRQLVSGAEAVVARLAEALAARPA